MKNLRRRLLKFRARGIIGGRFAYIGRRLNIDSIDQALTQEHSRRIVSGKIFLIQVLYINFNRFPNGKN
jgi:hypothetical protein